MPLGVLARCGSTARGRYNLRLMTALAVYVLFLTVAIRTILTDPPHGALRWLVALLPALPVLGMVVIMGLYLVEEQDEFRRMKTVQSMLGGLGLTLAITTVWGFLENLADAPHVPLYWVFPIYGLGLGMSQAVVSWRYR